MHSKWEIILCELLCKDIRPYMFIYARLCTVLHLFSQNIRINMKCLTLWKFLLVIQHLQSSCPYIHFIRIQFNHNFFFFNCLSFKFHVLYNGDSYIEGSLYWVLVELWRYASKSCIVYLIALTQWWPGLTYLNMKFYWVSVYLW